MDIVKFTKDSPLQRIKTWYMDENSLELSDADQLYKDRLYHIWSLRVKRDYSRQKAVEIISREYKVSQATAYRDYNNAQLIFGAIEVTNAAADRIVYIERYDRLYALAMQQGKVELAKKINDSLVKMLPPLEDGNKVDPKKLEASVYVMKLARKTGKILDKMVETGNMNLNGVFTEDAEFEEINADEEIEEGDEY